MTNLRDAAERLQRCDNGEPLLDVYPDLKNSQSENIARTFLGVDRETLADAYLSEHPADDDEPIDEAWLRSVGFELVPLEALAMLLRLGRIGVHGIWNELPDASWVLNCEDGGFARLPRPKTRGDLRRLCAALGVPLEETK